MKIRLPFIPLIKNPYHQSALGCLFRITGKIPSTVDYLKLPDGDILALERSTPSNWKEEGQTAVLIHGLCGSHNSSYMKRLSKKLFNKGIRVIRVNLRGCGSGEGLARNIYHAGISSDIEIVLRDLNRRFPKSLPILIGFSLGANIILKLAGELKEEARSLAHSVIAICPPIDLQSTADLLSAPHNQLLANRLLLDLTEYIAKMHHYFPDKPSPPPSFISLKDVDHLYVAPKAHFQSGSDYYLRSSSKPLIPHITLPTKILIAEDDPIISPSSFNDIAFPPSVTCYQTQHGGHLGFIGRNIFTQFRWMDNLILEWLTIHSS